MYVAGAWSMWNHDMEPPWWLHYSRWRRREQCGLVCKEIHHRKLFLARRNCSRRLHHLHPETGLCWGDVLRHTHGSLPGSACLMDCIVLFLVPWQMPLRPVWLQACHDVVEREHYFRLCLLEVCGCAPERACHCTVITAYAQHCAQEGAAVRWRNHTFCRKWGLSYQLLFMS